MIPAVTWTIRPRSGNSILGSLSSCASCCRHARRARHWGHREVSSWALIVPVHVESHIHPVVRGSTRGFTVGSSVAVSTALVSVAGRAVCLASRREATGSKFPEGVCSRKAGLMIARGEPGALCVENSSPVLSV